MRTGRPPGRDRSRVDAVLALLKAGERNCLKIQRLTGAAVQTIEQAAAGYGIPIRYSSDDRARDEAGMSTSTCPRCGLHEPHECMRAEEIVRRGEAA